jgi:predicted permease
MRLFRVVIHRFRSLFHRFRADADLQREIEIHFEQLVKEATASGMSESEARMMARREFGPVEQTKEECRDTRRVNLIENFMRDARHAWRALRRSPIYSLTAILILGIGIGANTTIFSIVHKVLLEPLPFPDSQKIMKVRRRTDWGSSSSFPMHDFTRIKAYQAVFSSLAITDWGGGAYNLIAGDKPEQISGVRVSAPFFTVLGIKPLLGQTFKKGDDIPGQPHLAIIDEALWNRNFGRDPSVIGRGVDISGMNYTIVGVVPDVLRVYIPADIFLCLPVPGESTERTNSFQVFGRLKPGISEKQAEAQIDALARRLAHNDPLTNMNRGLVLWLLRKQLTIGLRTGLEILFGAVAFVLLIACSNVANLALAKGSSRSRELAIMSALGASRGRVVIRLLTESALLAVGGGALGLFLAYLGIHILPMFAPKEFALAGNARLNVWVLVFVTIATALSAVLAGIFPALQLSRFNLVESLKQSNAQAGSSHSSTHLRSGLVAVQIALSTMLLTGSLLLVRSFWNLIHVDPGFRTDHVLTMKISVDAARYPTSARAAAYFDTVVNNIERLPGVVAASPTTFLPSECCMDFPVLPVGGHPRRSRSGENEYPWYRAVTPHFFRALSIPLLRGRYFQASDTPTSAPVIIVNQKLAKALFPDEEALGRSLILGAGYLKTAYDLRPRTIVGIVGDTHEEGLGYPPPLAMYLPAGQAPDLITRISLDAFPIRWVIRTIGDPMKIAPQIRRAVLNVDFTQPPADFETLEDFLSESIAANRFNMTMFTVFAALALFLAAIGIYGLMSYAVAQRTREIGIRIALGARRERVVFTLIAQGIRIGAIGIAVGLIAALSLTHLLNKMLFGVPPSDVVTLIVVTGMLLAVLLLANFLPSMRAASIDPLIALREE